MLQGKIVQEVDVADYQGEWHGRYFTLQDGRKIREYTDTDGNVNYRFVDAIPENRHESKEKNPFLKSVDSFKEIGKGFWDGATERAEKMTDSWYDFGHYWTLGAFDMGKDMTAGLQDRAETMLNSPRDFVNWLTIGSVDVVEGALNPDDPLSADHWMSSFNLAAIVAGPKVAKGPSPKPNALGKNVNVPSKPKTNPTPKPKQAPRPIVTKPPLIKSMNDMMEWIKQNIPEVAVVQDSAGGYHFAVGKKSGGGSAGGVTKAIDNNKRLIPGTSGKVTGGNSTVLGKNMLETMGVKNVSTWKGYQAHHIIPTEFKYHPALQKVGMDMDNAMNGVFLRNRTSAEISPKSRHQGYHRVYNKYVEKRLDKIDLNKPIIEIEIEIFTLQQDLKTYVDKGYPMYPWNSKKKRGDGATIELMERKIGR